MAINVNAETFLLLLRWDVIVCYTRFNHQIFIFLFLVSSLEEDPLYIAYADMMAKVFHSLNCFYCNVWCCSAKFCRFDVLLSPSELRWRRRRRRGGRKRENIWGAIDFSGVPFCTSLCFSIIFRSGAYCVVISHRKRKWRSKRCSTSRPDYTIEELQRWCFRWSVPAKVGRDTFIILPAYNCHPWCRRCVMYDLWSSGRLGAMVTFTLKLGISVLNGGNILVQQVRISQHAQFVLLWAFGHYLLCFLSWCRKCWTTWRKKEMLAFSKVCLDWWCLAGNEAAINYRTQNTGFTFLFYFTGFHNLYSQELLPNPWKQLCYVFCGSSGALSSLRK